jgi:hypothetical protein
MDRGELAYDALYEKAMRAVRGSTVTTWRRKQGVGPNKKINVGLTGLDRD